MFKYSHTEQLLCFVCICSLISTLHYMLDIFQQLFLKVLLVVGVYDLIAMLKYEDKEKKKA